MISIRNGRQSPELVFFTNCRPLSMIFKSSLSHEEFMTVVQYECGQGMSNCDPSACHSGDGESETVAPVKAGRIHFW